MKRSLKALIIIGLFFVVFFVQPANATSIPVEVWNKTFNLSSQYYINDVIRANDGNFVAVGYAFNYTDTRFVNLRDWYFLKIAPNGTKLWDRIIGKNGTTDQAYSIIQLMDGTGDYVVAGAISAPNSSTVRGGAMRISENGNIVWWQQYANAASIRSLAEDNGTNPHRVELVGLRQSATDGYLASIWSNNGTMIWEKYPGGSGNDYSYAGIVDSDGNYVMVGQSASYNSSTDFWWGKYSAGTGNEVYNRTQGTTTAGECLYDLIQTNATTYLVVGNNATNWGSVMLIDKSSGMAYNWTNETVRTNTYFRNVRPVNNTTLAIFGYTSLSSAYGPYFQYVDYYGKLGASHSWSITNPASTNCYIYSGVVDNNTGNLYGFGYYYFSTINVGYAGYYHKTDKNLTLDFDFFTDTTYSSVWKKVLPVENGNLTWVGYGWTNGNYSAMIMKTDKNGNEYWRRSINYYPTNNGSTPTEFNNVLWAQDGGYIAIGTQTILGQGYEGEAVKYDINGNMQWHQTYSQAAGNYVDRFYDGFENTTCYGFVGTTTGAGSGNQGWLVLVNKADGSLQCKRAYGGTGNEYFYANTIDSSGNLYAVGTTTSWGAGSTDSWIMKINGTSDNEAWNKTFGTSSASDAAYGITTLRDGNILMVGTYNALKAYANKYTPSGTLIWNQTYQPPYTTGQGFFYGAYERADGILMMGGYGPKASGNGNAFFIEANNAGYQIMNLSIGYGGGNEVIYGTAVDTAGNMLLAGATQSYYPVQKAWGAKINFINNILEFNSSSYTVDSLAGNVSLTVNKTASYNEQYLYLSDNTNSQWRMFSVDGYLEQNIPAYDASAQPRGILYNPYNGYMYGIGYNNNITYWNASTNNVTTGAGKIWMYGTNPFEAALSPDGKNIYISLYSAGKVAVISATNNTWYMNITVDTKPNYIAISPDGTKMYVSTDTGNKLWVGWTNGTKQQDVTTAGTKCYGLAFSPDGSKLYIAEDNPGKIAVMYTANNTITKRISVGLNPRAIATRLNGDRLYVVNYGASNVSVINTTTDSLVGSISLGQTGGWGITANPTDNNFMYVTGPNSLYVINTSTNAVASRTYISAATVRDIVCLPAAQVNYYETPGTATAGTDYTNTTGWIYFGRNDSQKQFKIPILYRQGAIGLRNFYINLSMAAYAYAGNITSTTVTINDPSLSQISFDSAKYIVLENAGTANLTVYKQGADQACCVNYLTSDGNATAGQNYTTTSGTLNFDIGQWTQTITVPIIDTHIYEWGNRYFNVSLSDPVNTSLSSNTSIRVEIQKYGLDSIHFKLSQVNISEACGAYNFYVNLDSPCGNTITVNYTTSDGTAIANTNYYPKSGTLTFAPGVTEQHTFVQPISSAGGSPFFFINLSSPTNAIISNPDVLKITITPKDTAALTSDYYYQPWSTGGNVSVNLNFNDTVPVNVTADFVLNGEFDDTTSDYGWHVGCGVSDSIITDSGSKVMQITLNDNTQGFGEGCVHFIQTIPQIAYDNHMDITLKFIAKQTFQYTNAGRVRFIAGAWEEVSDSISPDYMGYQQYSLNIPFSEWSLDWPNMNQIIVYVGWDDFESCVNGDQLYFDNMTIWYGNMTPPSYLAAQAYSRQINFDNEQLKTTLLNGYTNISGNYTYLLRLFDPASVQGSSVINMGIPEYAAVYVGNYVHGDAQVSMSPSFYSYNESAGIATVTVVRSLDTSSTSKVDYQTYDGSAMAGQNYVATAGTLTFLPGDASKNISVPLIDDGVYDDNKYFNVNLSNPLNNNIISSIATVNINNTDPQPSIIFNQSTYSCNSTDGIMTVYVNKTGSTATMPAYINYSTVDGTALTGQNYTATSGQIVFLTGDTQKSFNVSIINVLGRNSTFYVNLSQPVNCTFGTYNNSTVNINYPQGTSTLQFNLSSYVVNEAAGYVTLNVTKVGAVTCTVNYTTANGTAVSGKNYSTTSGQLNFDSGDTYKTISIPITKYMGMPLRDVGFSINISSPSAGALLGNYTTATVNITDCESLNSYFAHNFTIIINGSNDGTQYGYQKRFEIFNSTGSSRDNIMYVYGYMRNGWNDLYFTNGNDCNPIPFYIEANNSTWARVWSKVPFIPNGSNNQTSIVLWVSNGTMASWSNGNETMEMFDHFEGNSINTSRWENYRNWNNKTVSNSILRFGPTNIQDQEGIEMISAPWGDLGKGYALRTNFSWDSAGQDGTHYNYFGIGFFEPEPAGSTYQHFVEFSPYYSTDIYSSYRVSAWTKYLPLRYGSGVWHQLDIMRCNTSGTYGAIDDSLTYIPFAASGYNAGVAFSLISSTTNPSVYIDWIFVRKYTPNEPQITKYLMDGQEEYPVIVMNNSRYVVSENGISVQVNVTRLNNLSVAFSVDYRTMPGTATAPSNFTTTSGTLTFAAHEISKTVDIPIIYSDNWDIDREFYFNLTTNTSAFWFGQPRNATVNITNANPCSLQFNLSSLVVNDTDGIATVNITRSGQIDMYIAVNLNTSDGTATFDNNYTATNQVLTFLPGETYKLVNIPITPNQYDSDETKFFYTNLSSPVNCTLGIPNSVRVIIINTKWATTVNFNQSLYYVNDINGSLCVNVNLSMASITNVTIDYVTVNGSATYPQNYTFTYGHLTFVPEVTSQTFTIPINNPGWLEVINNSGQIEIYNRSFYINLTNGTHCRLGQNANVQINNTNVPTVQFNASRYIVMESAGEAIINVILSQTLPFPVTVNYSTSDGSAMSGMRFSMELGTTMAGNDNTNLAIADINNLMDNNLAIANLNDSAAIDQYNESYAMTEGNYSIDGNIAIVSKNDKSSAMVDMGYIVESNPAIEGLNYEGTSGVLTFDPGVTSQTLRIHLYDNNIYDIPQNFNINLSGYINIDYPFLPHVRFGPRQNDTVYIAEDDYVTVQFNQTTYAFTDGGNYINVTVVKTGETTLPITVPYSTRDGTLHAGQNYTAQSGTLTIYPDQTSVNITIPLINSTVNDYNKKFYVDLHNTSHPIPGANYRDPDSTFNHTKGPFNINFMWTGLGRVYVTNNPYGITSPEPDDWLRVFSQTGYLEFGYHTTSWRGIADITDICVPGNNSIGIVAVNNIPIFLGFCSQQYIVFTSDNSSVIDNNNPVIGANSSANAMCCKLYDANLSYSYPHGLSAGSSFTLNITAINIGGMPWTQNDNIWLYGINNDSALFGPTQFALPSGVIVQPGQSYTFNLNLIAPTTLGIYQPSYQMVCGGSVFGNSAPDGGRLYVAFSNPIVSNNTTSVEFLYDAYNTIFGETMLEATALLTSRVDYDYAYLDDSHPNQYVWHFVFRTGSEMMVRNNNNYTSSDYTFSINAGDPVSAIYKHSLEVDESIPDNFNPWTSPLPGEPASGACPWMGGNPTNGVYSEVALIFLEGIASELAGKYVEGAGFMFTTYDMLQALYHDDDDAYVVSDDHTMFKRNWVYPGEPPLGIYSNDTSDASNFMVWEQKLLPNNVDQFIVTCSMTVEWENKKQPPFPPGWYVHDISKTYLITIESPPENMNSMNEEELEQYGIEKISINNNSFEVSKQDKSLDNVTTNLSEYDQEYVYIIPKDKLNKYVKINVVNT